MDDREVQPGNNPAINPTISGRKPSSSPFGGGGAHSSEWKPPHNPLPPPPASRPSRRAKQPSTASREGEGGGGADRRRRPSRRGGTSKRGRGIRSRSSPPGDVKMNRIQGRNICCALVSPSRSEEEGGLIIFCDLALASPTIRRRDWSNLGDGPAGLIAERVLAFDVADYLRFRAVCRPWRQCSTEPRTHGGLDRRFHPWRWVLLREPLAAPNRRCFLNSFTGEFIQVDIPELLDLLAVTPEGLLVLLHDHNHVRLLNPLTRHLTGLPPLNTLLPSKDHVKLSHFNIDDFLATGSGIASDDSTVLLCFNRFCILGMAKPGDDHWILQEYNHDRFTVMPLMFAGRFYHVNFDGVMALQICPDQPPRLEVAANLNMHVSPISHGLHLVNSCGDLMLIHRQVVPLTSRNKSCYRYNMYQVDLDTRTLLPVKSLGGRAGRAMIWGLQCSFSVPLEVFPSGSMNADTIYPSFDFTERSLLKVGACHLVDGRIERPSSLVQRPANFFKIMHFFILNFRNITP